MYLTKKSHTEQVFSSAGAFPWKSALGLSMAGPGGQDSAGCARLAGGVGTEHSSQLPESGVACSFPKTPNA